MRIPFDTLVNKNANSCSLGTYTAGGTEAGSKQINTCQVVSAVGNKTWWLWGDKVG